jgi:hypothetical protein
MKTCSYTIKKTDHYRFGFPENCSVGEWRTRDMAVDVVSKNVGQQ